MRFEAEMFVQSSTFVFCSLSFIVFLFVSVNGQIENVSVVYN